MLSTQVCIRINGYTIDRYKRLAPNRAMGSTLRDVLDTVADSDAIFLVPHERSDTTYTIPCSAEQSQRWREAAHDRHMAIGPWIRGALALGLKVLEGP